VKITRGVWAITWNKMYWKLAAASRKFEQKNLIGKLWRKGNIRVKWYWDTFAKPFLLWKDSKHYIFWVCPCSLAYPACKAHSPHYIVTCCHSYIITTCCHSHIITTCCHSHIITTTACKGVTRAYALRNWQKCCRTYRRFDLSCEITDWY
jgi:hypothetical protein